MDSYLFLTEAQQDKNCREEILPGGSVCGNEGYVYSIPDCRKKSLEIKTKEITYQLIKIIAPKLVKLFEEPKFLKNLNKRI
ncbi:MAG: hypothetical protein NC928_03390 [Candidatus Omnitrophica bacterium]|nr:hypothetical protein [Candidatus Omnitrophota bacterium]